MRAKKTIPTVAHVDPPGSGLRDRLDRIARLECALRSGDLTAAEAADTLYQVYLLIGIAPDASPEPIRRPPNITGVVWKRAPNSLS